MLGTEKKPDQPFQFDLEQQMQSDPGMAKKLLNDVREKTTKLKNLLRQGAETEDFDDYGVLLHGYAALERVLKRVMEKT